MKKIEAIIQPFKLEEVVNALADIGIDGITVTDVKGHGRQRGPVEVYRGQEYRADLLHKIKIEVVAHDSDGDAIIAAICKAARTGHAGDGKIFVYAIPEAIRIRNGQRNEAAI
jgi:nitrogen regulatory protein P-II 1